MGTLISQERSAKGARKAFREQRRVTRGEQARQEQLFNQFQVPALQGLQQQVTDIGDTRLLRQRAGIEGLNEQLRGAQGQIRKLFLQRGLKGKEARALAASLHPGTNLRVTSEKKPQG